MAYLLDANIFIQAKNLHYGLDFCPLSGSGLLKITNLKLFSALKKLAMKLMPVQTSSLIGRRSVTRIFFSSLIRRYYRP